MWQTSVVHSKGTVKAVGIGIYWESACITKVTEIDWGIVEPGISVNKTIYAKNDQSNVQVGLDFSTQNWVPTQTSNYTSLNWDYLPGTKLAVNETKAVTFILTIDLSVVNASPKITDFSFDMVIKATG